MTKKNKKEKEEITDEQLDAATEETTEEIIEPEVTEPEPETEPEPSDPKGKYNGKEITIKRDGAEYKGLCVSERDTNSGAQVFLQLNGCVSRWFNVDDIA